MDLGHRVRDLRNAQHLSQIELAARAGVARNTLNRIENGHLMPTAPVIEHLAEALSVAPGALFEEPALAGKDKAPRKAGPEKQLPEEAGEERRPDDEVTQRRIYTGIAAERARLLESIAELWDRLLDGGERDVDTLRQIEHVTLEEIINHAFDEEEIKERCAPEQRDQLERAEQRLLEADRRVSRAIEAKLPSSEIDKWRAARAEQQARFQHLGIAKLA
jgi:transcriptional regulator with XRE-family HTH domain